MNEAPSGSIYHFAGFRVERARRRLVAGGDQEVPLSSRAFDVLLHLVDNRARVVPKQDLLEAVWPDVVVEENNLSQAISALRKALGDSREAPRFIATIPGRGFQFVAEVTVERSSALPRSIAVLPLRPLSVGDPHPVLELGMTESLINQLSTLAGLRIAPLSSVRRFTGPAVDPVAAGRAIGVQAVLEGHLLTDRSRVRITARLLDTTDGTAIWAGRFDGSAADLIGVQDELASRLVEALSLDLTREARAELTRRATHDDTAWRLYLSGRYHWDRKTPDGNARAIEFYQAAIDRDPRFALPYAGLADAYAVLAIFNIQPTKHAMTEARRMALRAIELDEHLAEAHASLGHVYTQLEHRWDDADRCYEKALALKPGYAQAWMWQATNATYRRRMPLALEHIRHAQSLEPMSLTFASIAGMIMYFARDFDGARDQLSRMVETVPDAPLPRHLYARVLLALGEAENVVAMLEGDSTRGPFCLSNLGRAYAMCGMRDAALAEIARVRALGERGYGVGYDLAQIFVALGEHEAAVEALERAVDDGSQTVAYFESDIAVDPIRDDPRLRTVARRLGLPLP